MDSVKRFIFLALMVSMPLLAEELKLTRDGPWVSWQKTSDTQVRFACEGSPCAFPASLNPSELKKISVDWEVGGVNPSAILCRSLKGTVGIARLKNGDELSVCQIDKQVWVHGWDLYGSWKKTQKP